MLKIDIAASQGPGDLNEDAIGHYGDAAWVIDGATGIGGALLEEPSDAAWLARTANRFMAEVLSESPELATPDILRIVMARCGEALRREAVRSAQGQHELPSAAFAMIRVRDGEAEFTTLADCRVIAADNGAQARLYGASAHETIEAGTLQAAKALLEADPNITAESLKNQLLPRLRANRQMMNQEGGYWVLGIDPAAADHIWQTTVPASPGQRFAVASDGFLRLIEIFDVMQPHELLAMSNDDDWARWLHRLRDLEAAPDSLHRYTRVKRHDDASLIVCTWQGDN